VQRVAAVTPEAGLRFDANEGFRAEEALRLVEATIAAGLTVECFEQPCARGDLNGMRRIREASDVPVVADESVVTELDVERLADRGAVDGVNLKLVKMGGIDRCIAIGRRAQSLGLEVMVGAMVESRLGLTAMAHVVAVLGGVAWVDLDTAFLLAHDPVQGGLVARGSEMTLPDGPGLDIALDGVFAPAR
jgi:L-alanine-DL-glutamate epimerase-like enolase superfamily enzyme